jgi:hypothetical protein
MKSRREIESELWHERSRIRSERSDFMRAAMEDYDKEVYYPAMDELQQRCEDELGHIAGSWQNNGWGRSWRECTICHKVVEEEYYEI